MRPSSENRFTAFNHLFVYNLKANLETRLWEHAAMVRTGKMTREEAYAAGAAPTLSN